MTARDTIDAAMLARGMGPLPQPWECPCCHSMLDPEEQGDPEFFRHSAELVARYGEMPCFMCADDHDLCAYCGKAILQDDPDFPDRRENETLEREPFCSAACQDDWWRDTE